MAYITLAQSKQALGSLLYNSAYDDFVNPGTASDVVLQEDIDFVTGVIDSCLVQTYNSVVVPITGTSALALLKGYAESLLIYKANTRFDDAEVPPVVVDRNREVLDKLQRLKDGFDFLPDTGQDPLTGAVKFSFNSATENSTTNSTVFKRSNMRGV